MSNDRQGWGGARVAYIAVEAQVRERVRDGFPLKQIWRELAPGMSYRTFTFWRRRREWLAAREAAAAARPAAPPASTQAAQAPRRWDPAALDREALIGSGRAAP